MSGMRAAILGILVLALAGCAAKPTPQLVAEQFGDVVFSTEFGPQNPYLVRWPADQPAKTFLLDDTDRARGFIPEGGHLGEILTRETSIDFALEPRYQDANFVILLAPRWKLDDLRIEHLPDHIRCFAAIKNDRDRNIILVVIGIDSALGDDRIKHCLAEELTQAMGLRNDACNYSPSLFCEADSHLHAPTDADRLMLRVLYDPALQPGMTREAAMPIVRRLIRERWSEYME